MKTIHFVYALPRLANRFHARIQRTSQKFLHRQVIHGQIGEYRWPKPLSSPFSITYHVGNFFEERFRLKLYDLRERTKIHPREGDILLGHAWPDPKSVMWQALENPLFAKRYLIGPYNNDQSQVGWMREALGLSDNFFGICGDYWIDNFSSSPLKEFEDKFVHLNMSVDAGSYPVVKKNFNPPGNRRFFYIGRHGRFGDEKGIGLLEELATRIPGFKGGYICSGGEIKGWEKISEPTELTSQFMQKLAQNYDVFINMSRADAQATTIVEAMSWGFPVACTKQSGYSKEADLFYLSLDDMAGNVESIEKIQSLPDCELKRIAVANRAVVETKYSWGSFLSRMEKYF